MGGIALQPTVAPIAQAVPAASAAPRFTGLIFLRDVAIGLFLWVALTALVGEAPVVPTGSMEPTIQVGDRLWTDKLLLHFEPIRRGDIVVFEPPVEPGARYVKRVVGLPGETVAVHDGQVLVEGVPLTEPYIGEVPAYEYGPVTIPAGQYFVLGDNRNVSYDSHAWGLVARDRITARAVYRIWPVGRAGRL
jgi:signal peptidase I